MTIDLSPNKVLFKKKDTAKKQQRILKVQPNLVNKYCIPRAKIEIFE